MSAERFFKKSLALLDFLKSIYPDEPKIDYAESLLRTAYGFNHELPLSKMYANLSMSTLNTNKSLLDYIREVDDICAVDLKSFPPVKLLPDVDLTKPTPAQRRRIWTYVRELVLLCGHTLDRVEPIDKRAVAFNQTYRTLLANMEIAFPRSTPMNIVDVFDMDVRRAAGKPSSVCLERFRQVVKPVGPQLMQNPDDIIKSPALFEALPYFCLLPLRDYWQESVVDSVENQGEIIRQFCQLIMTSTGLNALPAGLLDHVHGLIQTRTSQLEAATDVSQVMPIAQALVQSMQGDTMKQLAESMKDIMPTLDNELLAPFIQGAAPAEFQAALNGLLSGQTGEKPF